jgi:hypothetical protein
MPHLTVSAGRAGEELPIRDAAVPARHVSERWGKGCSMREVAAAIAERLETCEANT